MSPRLEVRDAVKAYGATVALARGSLTVEPGEVHVLIGSNGSGKSTLCKIVAGSISPDSGTLRIDGREASVAGPTASRELGIGVFYQELSLAPHRSVAENLALGHLGDTSSPFLDRRRMRERAAREIARFADVAGPGLVANAPVGALRPDQRQLVEIMKCLSSDAPILVFDEPTSALDRAQVTRFFKVLRERQADGCAIVFISHRMDEIFEIGDRVTVIREGETVLTAPLEDTDADGIVRAMVGEATADDRAGEPVVAPVGAEGGATVAARPSGDPGTFSGTRTDPLHAVLSVQGLSGGGCRDVSLEVRRGEIVGLGGLHGQGQSALLRTLFGLLPRRSGSVALDGEPLAANGPRAAIRRGLAYVSGDRGRDGTVTGRSILENVVPVHALLARLSLARPGSLRAVAAPALERLNTKYASLGHPISSLSGGNQQKVVIARWLTERPSLVLLDDPTKGIDLAAKLDLFTLVRELASAGTAVLLYSSEDTELLTHADRILVFNAGRVGEDLVGERRTRHALYRAAYDTADAAELAS